MDRSCRCFRGPFLVLVRAVSLLLLSAAHLRPPIGASNANSAFAAPTIMIFSGGPLHDRIILDNFQENMRILTSARLVESPERGGGRRPLIDVWLFWGIQWKPLVGQKAALNRLTAADANQRGRFYPAQAEEDAILVLDATLMSPQYSARSLEPVALDILRRHGVPVRMTKR